MTIGSGTQSDVSINIGVGTTTGGWTTTGLGAGGFASAAKAAARTFFAQSAVRQTIACDGSANDRAMTIPNIGFKSFMAISLWF
jgi:hypothetical protein